MAARRRESTGPATPPASPQRRQARSGQAREGTMGTRSGYRRRVREAREWLKKLDSGADPHLSLKELVRRGERLFGRLQKRDPELYVAVELLIWGEVMTPEELKVVEKGAMARLATIRDRKRFHASPKAAGCALGDGRSSRRRLAARSRLD